MRHYYMKCMARECAKCGVTQLREHFKPVSRAAAEQETLHILEVNQWTQQRFMNDKGEEKRKLTLVTKFRLFDGLIDMLCAHL